MNDPYHEIHEELARRGIRTGANMHHFLPTTQVPPRVNPDVGRELWRELHTEVTLETLAAWEAKLPRYGCWSCESHYQYLKRQRPPEHEVDFFAWTVWLHNQVNERLSRRTWTMQEAITFWRK